VVLGIYSGAKSQEIGATHTNQHWHVNSLPHSRTRGVRHPKRPPLSRQGRRRTDSGECVNDQARSRPSQTVVWPSPPFVARRAGCDWWHDTVNRLCGPTSCCSSGTDRTGIWQSERVLAGRVRDPATNPAAQSPGREPEPVSARAGVGEGLCGARRFMARSRSTCRTIGVILERA
jgi:hypothetical protein